MRAKRGCREVSFLKAVLLVGILCVCPVILAAVPPPYWRVSFDGVLFGAGLRIVQFLSHSLRA